MKHTNRAASNAAQQHDWRNAETDDELLNAGSFYEPDEDDDEEEETEEERDDDSGDWGHTDPTDSPFPDSNDPTAPGSAV